MVTRASNTTHKFALRLVWTLFFIKFRYVPESSILWVCTFRIVCMYVDLIDTWLELLLKELNKSSDKEQTVQIQKIFLRLMDDMMRNSLQLLKQGVFFFFKCGCFDYISFKCINFSSSRWNVDFHIIDWFSDRLPGVRFLYTE